MMDFFQSGGCYVIVFLSLIFFDKKVFSNFKSENYGRDYHLCQLLSSSYGPKQLENKKSQLKQPNWTKKRF